jgi:uracil-DNA glycosylase
MTWDQLIQTELKKEYFSKLIDFLRLEDKHKVILPPKEKRMACFHMTPFDQVKVVIIGQDPYHNLNQAHGLSFSVETGLLPPSLKNIFKEMVDDLKLEYIPKTGNLSSWAKQGVLLLNTILTVELHRPLSHQNKGWEEFTLEVVKVLNQQRHHLVFILWGANAKKFIPYIDVKKHMIIESVHPSPLSASRGFFKSKPFSKCNRYLISKGIEAIDWLIV